MTRSMWSLLYLVVSYTNHVYIWAYIYISREFIHIETQSLAHLTCDFKCTILWHVRFTHTLQVICFHLTTLETYPFSCSFFFSNTFYSKHLKAFKKATGRFFESSTKTQRGSSRSFNVQSSLGDWVGRHGSAWRIFLGGDLHEMNGVEKIPAKISRRPSKALFCFFPGYLVSQIWVMLCDFCGTYSLCKDFVRAFQDHHSWNMGFPVNLYKWIIWCPLAVLATNGAHQRGIMSVNKKVNSCRGPRCTWHIHLASWYRLYIFYFTVMLCIYIYTY